MEVKERTTVWAKVSHLGKRLTSCFGGKNWSLLEILYKAPKEFFAAQREGRPFDSSKLTNKGYHPFQALQMTPDELETKLPYYTMAATPYKEDEDWVKPFGYNFIDPATLPINRPMPQRGTG